MPNGRITPQQAKAELAQSTSWPGGTWRTSGGTMEPSWTVSTASEADLRVPGKCVSLHRDARPGRHRAPDHRAAAAAHENNVGQPEFPAWLLGELPDSNVLLTSYGADLATESSRKVRNMIQGERYKNVFGERSALDEAVEISPDGPIDNLVGPGRAVPGGRDGSRRGRRHYRPAGGSDRDRRSLQRPAGSRIRSSTASRWWIGMTAR